MNEIKIIYVMGVSGSGKSTIGKLLASKLDYTFFDGDDFHPQENVDKMASGKPLNDLDRAEWLQRLNELAQKKKTTGAVIACSALKEKYRQQLTKNLAQFATFVYLKGSFEQINNRMQNRKGHFMPSKLLQSQFDTLEPPKNAIVVSIADSPDQLVKAILNQLY